MTETGMNNNGAGAVVSLRGGGGGGSPMGPGPTGPTRPEGQTRFAVEFTDAEVVRAVNVKMRLPQNEAVATDNLMLQFRNAANKVVERVMEIRALFKRIRRTEGVCVGCHQHGLLYFESRGGLYCYACYRDASEYKAIQLIFRMEQNGREVPEFLEFEGTRKGPDGKISVSLRLPTVPKSFGLLKAATFKRGETSTLYHHAIYYVMGTFRTWDQRYSERVRKKQRFENQLHLLREMANDPTKRLEKKPGDTIEYKNKQGRLVTKIIRAPYYAHISENQPGKRPYWRTMNQIEELIDDLEVRVKYFKLPKAPQFESDFIAMPDSMMEWYNEQLRGMRKIEEQLCVLREIVNDPTKRIEKKPGETIEYKEDGTTRGKGKWRTKVIEEAHYAHVSEARAKQPRPQWRTMAQIRALIDESEAQLRSFDISKALQDVRLRIGGVGENIAYLGHEYLQARGFLAAMARQGRAAIVITKETSGTGKRARQEYYMHFPLTEEVKVPKPDASCNMVGVNWGIRNAAVVVALDPKTFEPILVRFCPAGVITARREALGNVRRARVRRGKGDRNKGWFKEADYVNRAVHDMTRAIIDDVKDHCPNPMILTLEEARDNKEDKKNRSIGVQKKSHHQGKHSDAKWKKNFRRVLNRSTRSALQRQLEYKGQLDGMDSDRVNPTFNSDRCWICGQEGERGEQFGEKFVPDDKIAVISCRHNKKCRYRKEVPAADVKKIEVQVVGKDGASEPRQTWEVIVNGKRIDQSKCPACGQPHLTIMVGKTGGKLFRCKDGGYQCNADFNAGANDAKYGYREVGVPDDVLWRPHAKVANSTVPAVS